MFRIVSYLIARPLVSNLLIFFIIFLAFAQSTRLKRQGFPRVDLKKMVITTIYPGAAPEDVELNVTAKIEEALEEVDGIDYYSSISLENQSVIEVSIDPDAEDPEDIKADIRRAVDGVSDLPDEIDDDPHILEIKVDNFEIYEVALVSDTVDRKTLRKYILDLKQKILRLDTVARVYEKSIPDREIRVLLNQKKMQQKFISFSEVTDAIKHNKLRLSGGSLESYTSRKGIVTFSEFENPEDIEEVYIRASDLNYAVQIKDIGRAVEALEEQNEIVRYNGRPGMSIYVVKKGRADIIEAVEDIKQVVAEYRQNTLPDTVESFSTFDASIDTESRLNTVYSNAGIGFILVLIVLFLFLDKKVAFWTATGIPFSVAIALICLPLFDITLNSISLLGIVVVLGMLVDDAIIVAESIYRAGEEGESRTEAALTGLRQVVKPVFATIVTTVIAFIPMYFTPGMAGDFSREIPSIVIIMLLASLFEATLLLPAHLAHGKENRKTSQPVGQKLINLLQNRYRYLLENILRRRRLTAIVLTVVFAALFLSGASIVRFKMFPVDQATRLYLYGETGPESSLEYTSREVRKLEKIVEETGREILHSFNASIGLSFNPGGPSHNSANQFYMQLELVPAGEREQTATGLQKEIFRQVEEKKINTFKKLDYYIDGGGPPAGKPLEIRITGNNRPVALEIMSEIRDVLSEYPVSQIDSDYRKGKTETRLIPDYFAVSKAGLSVAQIASTIRTAIDGSIVTELQTAEESIPFRVMLDKESLNFENPLQGLQARNAYGNLVPVSNLVTKKRTVSPETIHRYNGERTYTMTANIDLEKITPEEILSALKPDLQKIENNHNGFKIEFGGEAEKDVETRHDMLLAIIGAVTAIYFTLVLQFNSFSQPLLVLMAIPFGLTGILLAFGLQGMDLSMMALTGILGFAGVVINDSLVMVEFMNRLHDEYEQTASGFQQAVIEGAVLRLRPILLTTLTTLAGLVPTAYGFIGGIDSFVSPMVMAMTWGLVVGTASILLVIPLLYSFNHSIRNRLGRLFSKEKILSE